MEVRKASPVVMIAQTIRASLLANATAATLAGLRALSEASQSHNAPARSASRGSYAFRRMDDYSDRRLLSRLSSWRSRSGAQGRLLRAIAEAVRRRGP